jgi:hypothetical protein
MFSGGHVRLKASEARDLMTIRQEAFNRTLGIIRQMCDTTIRETSQSNKAHFIEYEVPRSVFGCEAFDQSAMGKALAQELYVDGFDVKGTSKKLRISWAKPEDDTDELPVSVHSSFMPTTFTRPLSQPKTGGKVGKGGKVEVSLAHIR